MIDNDDGTGNTVAVHGSLYSYMRSINQNHNHDDHIAMMNDDDNMTMMMIMGEMFIQCVLALLLPVALRSYRILCHLDILREGR